jgi:hypothetical protein
MKGFKLLFRAISVFLMGSLAAFGLNLIIHAFRLMGEAGVPRWMPWLMIAFGVCQIIAFAYIIRWAVQKYREERG